MKLEEQVCSLELAKELKELGVRQHSRFYWFAEKTDIPNVPLLRLMMKPGLVSRHTRIASAFTVAELGEMLPWEYSTSSRREKGQHICGERSDSGYGTSQRSETEADARAKMLVYLLKRNSSRIAVPRRDGRHGGQRNSRW